MPETPSKAALEAARQLCDAHSWIGGLCRCGEFAAALDAFAAERIAEVVGRGTDHDSRLLHAQVLMDERDAALAKLEAAEAELQGLREIATSPPTLPIMERSLLSSDRGRPLSPSVLTPNWPADLLAAVQTVDEIGGRGWDMLAGPEYDKQTAEWDAARATLRRYGLLPAAPMEEAK